ncbi:MAG TPA: hypothetical protein VHE12_01845, partial [bacterium]|nr:hypothetical protein [bacterium]
GLFSMLYYMGLRAYTARLLGQGAGIGGPSWAWTLGRYAAAVVVLALLAKVSVLCLLAALAVHAGSLGILFWTGTRIHDTGNHTG